MPKRRYRILAPSAVTSANIAAGFMAMVAAADGRFELAVYLLVVAILCDVLDGTIARLLGATSEFGQEMDSFSDAISFGVAPAFLIYLAVLRPLGFWGLIVSLVYLLAGVTRLIRFVLTSDAHVKELRTTGAPIPVAASYLMATVLMRDSLSVQAAAVVVLAMALLMISRIGLPSLKGKNIVTAMLLVGIVNYLAVVFLPSWPTIVWWNVWNACILLVARIHNSRLEPSEAP
ncbi:MAG: CDP-diacylglycerol--serine O-phosphatidyltransferase [Thermoanaerobaculales bacterium]|jgi:CDP-diacylglycerol--serine O-phosphatidyltransferase|nr:CDP-diacylglycerol--serine O-phosphatidyltransferase [Thermoanaerobaculales bacterium]